MTEEMIKSAPLLAALDTLNQNIESLSLLVKKDLTKGLDSVLHPIDGVEGASIEKAPNIPGSSLTVKVTVAANKVHDIQNFISSLILQLDI